MYNQELKSTTKMDLIPEIIHDSLAGFDLGEGHKKILLKQKEENKNEDVNFKRGYGG